MSVFCFTRILETASISLRCCFWLCAANKNTANKSTACEGRVPRTSTLSLCCCTAVGCVAAAAFWQQCRAHGTRLHTQHPDEYSSSGSRRYSTTQTLSQRQYSFACKRFYFVFGWYQLLRSRVVVRKRKPAQHDFFSWVRPPRADLFLDVDSSVR